MFSCKYCECFKTTSILKMICEQLLLKVKLILFKVCVWLKFTFWNCTFSNIAQMRLLLCKFAEELHFWAITLWTWVIYVPLMSYVLILILFVKQNIWMLFKRNPRVTKTSHMCKNLLIFFFCILIIDIFHFWRCSTKGAAQGLRFKLILPRK